MKNLRLLVVIIFSLMLLTLMVELIELTIVALISDRSLSALSQDQAIYFEIRNQIGVLVAKLFYTLSSAFLVSYFGARLLLAGKKTYYLVLSAIQIAGICYGAFFSDYKDSLATWYWLLLLLLILTGFRLAFQMSKKHIVE